MIINNFVQYKPQKACKIPVFHNFSVQNPVSFGGFSQNVPSLSLALLEKDVFKKQTVFLKPEKSAKTENLPFETISYKEAEDLMYVNSVKKVQDYLRENKSKFTAQYPADENPVIENMFEIEGVSYDARFSGDGGTKNTFQIEKDGKKFILALPNYVDSPHIAGEKWLDVLEFEPENTKFLRDEDFRVNDIFEIVPVKVNGAEFPAVLMKPYSEHSFEIADVKNYSSANFLSPDDIETLSPDKIISLYSNIPKEIAKLVFLQIEPDYDCINLCKDKSSDEIHLYLNDLGKEMTVEKFSDYEARMCIKYFVMLAVSALKSAVGPDAQNSIKYIETASGLLNQLEELAYQEYLKIE